MWLVWPTPEWHSDTPKASVKSPHPLELCRPGPCYCHCPTHGLPLGSTTGLVTQLLYPKGKNLSQSVLNLYQRDIFPPECSLLLLISLLTALTVWDTYWLYRSLRGQGDWCQWDGWLPLHYLLLTLEHKSDNELNVTWKTENTARKENLFRPERFNSNVFAS